MAQVVITTIDPVNGSISSTIKLKDVYLQRIYSAYKYNQAAQYLKQKIESGEVLESYDTAENIMEKVSAQSILDNLVERFIQDLSNYTLNIELKKNQEEFISKLGRIEWE